MMIAVIIVGWLLCSILLWALAVGYVSMIIFRFGWEPDYCAGC